MNSTVKTKIYFRKKIPTADCGIIFTRNVGTKNEINPYITKIKVTAVDVFLFVDIKFTLLIYYIFFYS